MKMKLNTTEKMTVTLVIFNLIVFGGLIFWHVYIWNVADQIREQKSEIATDNSEMNPLSLIKKDTEDTKAMIQIVDSLFVSESNVVEFIEVLESMADSTGAQLEIQVFDLVEATDKKEVQSEIRVGLQVFGAWQSVTQFVVMLEKNPFYIDFEEVRIESVANNGNQQWRATVSMRALAK